MKNPDGYLLTANVQCSPCHCSPDRPPDWECESLDCVSDFKENQPGSVPPKNKETLIRGVSSYQWLQVVKTIGIVG